MRIYDWKFDILKKKNPSKDNYDWKFEFYVHFNSFL